MSTYLYRLPVLVLCAAFSVGAVGCAATPTHTSTGQYIDDGAITTKVKVAIFNDASLSSAGIHVRTFAGVVQISGFVTSNADIERVSALAENVSGVNSVHNRLKVQ